MDSVILLCKYHGESCRIRMFRDSKLLHLYEKLSSRWSGLKSGGVKLSYSLPGDPFCLIQNDEDLEIMLDMMFKPGCHEIYVSIVDCGSSSSGSTTYGCSRKSEVLSSFRREWSLDVDKEVDLMPSFCDHRDTVLLSAGWRDLIKEIGQKFVGVVEFREALSKFAIYFGFEYDFIKNDKERVSAACRMKHSDLACPWMVHGRVDHLSGNFYIRQLTNSHTCGASVLKLKHSRATSSLVGKLLIEDIRSQPLKRPVDVASDLKRLYGVSVSYTRAWMGVEKAKADAFGDYSTSFDDLRWWVDAARKSNPESVFEGVILEEKL